ncbi:MAG TPA: hypothetical protein DHW45_08020, partial [Candidatus Latescibacteria bacterium]|nr:hypothetical protein [Candidatus Latescibacterota bacterium]
MERPRTTLAVSLYISALTLVFASEMPAQTIDVLPDEIPSGVLSPSTYRQRLDVLLHSGDESGFTKSFTITIPPEVSIVSGSVTTTTDNASLKSHIAGFPASNKIAIGLTGTMSSRTVTVEYDARSPSSWTGPSAGAFRDTAYVFDFAAAFNHNKDKRPKVALNQSRPVRFVNFTSPDSLRGDTTSLGGRYHKMTFPSRYGPSDAFGLPDLAHTGLTTASQGFSDNQTDVTFSFYLSTDSTLITNSGMTSASLFTVGADDVPLVGQRQSPRQIPATFIRENFTSVFGDTTEAVISLASTAHNTKVYLYVTSDVTGKYFIGRSGPLLTRHPPEFVIAGWDYDNEGGDDFSTTGILQVPSELINGGGQKDNNNIVVDSGGFVPRGSAIPHVGFDPTPLTALNLCYKLEDSDNQGSVLAGIFLVPSANADPTASDLDPRSTGAPDSLRNSVTIADSLTANQQIVSFQGFERHPTTNQIISSSIVPAGSYKVFLGAIDGTGNKTLYKIVQDPFAASVTNVTLTVSHSPRISIDAAQFNDFDGDGDLDVETGIGVSQMITSTTGHNLSYGPSRRFVPISWGRAGIEGDFDVDGTGTIDLYYSTRSDFRSVEGSYAYTSGNSDGADILAAITQGNNDTHLIVQGVGLASDGQFDNLYNWDVWNYVSAEGTVPASDTRYYIYGRLKDGSTNRLVSFTSAGAINFSHPPYISVTQPAMDLSVNVGDPVQVAWRAIDIDNSPDQASIPALGLAAPNSRTSSPNIRILLTSADFGEVTTWASVVAQAAVEPFWVGNSTDGTLTGEVELNEGVDTSFVIAGERMKDNLSGVFRQQGLKIGVPLNVYVSIDGRGDADLPTNFDDYSPTVKAPGKIIFAGVEPTSAPPATTEFVVPEDLEVTIGESFQFTVVPNVAPASTTVKVVNVYLTADASKFTPMDTNSSTAGIQPFTIGTPENILSSKVTQGAYKDPSDATKWRLDFRWDDSSGSGVTFFDGVRPICIANFEVTGAVGSGEITLDGSGTRESNMLSSTLADLDPPAVAATTVSIASRATVSGMVPLQGKDDAAHPSATQVTFFLREAGSFTSFTDSLFLAQDEDTNSVGIQVTTTGIHGTYTLRNVPPGRFILTAAVPRYLTGHDTVNLRPGVMALSNINPVKLGDGIGAELLGGDASGYVNSSGAMVPDNQINSEDINAINAALFKVRTDAEYNTFADINQDSVVNGTDKDMATANQTSILGESGKRIPIAPTFKQAVITGDNSEAMLKLSGYPEHEVKHGEVFDVTVEIDGAAHVRTYEFHLSFDPRSLAVVDLVSNGNMFTNYTADMGGKLHEGKLGLVNSIIGRTRIGASGTGTLATIQFRAIGRSVRTPLELTDGLLINVDHDGVTPLLNAAVLIELSKDPIRYYDNFGSE